MIYEKSESCTLQVLTLDEVNEVNGGLLPLLVAYGVGFAAGFLAGASDAY